MKLTWNNFCKAYFLFFVTLMGWMDGYEAYHTTFAFLKLLAILAAIQFPLLYFGLYAALKTLLHFKPDAGCRGCRTEGPTDAQDIVRQYEENFQGLKECVKHPIETLILIVMNIVAFLKS